MSAAGENYLRETLMDSPFHQWLKPEVSAVADDDNEVVIRLPLRKEFNRDEEGSGVHGGVISALIDIAGHAAIAARTRHGTPTIDMRVDYLRMAVGQELLAKAENLKFGRTLGVVDISVFDDEQRLVATGRCIYLTRSA
jgi:uncharacterized protein (TIGR00369 family)